jgi:septum formation inhibitor MinC
MHALARPVVLVARPKIRTQVKAKDIKRAIDRAKLLCLQLEDTIECRLAWEEVEELSVAYSDQKRAEDRASAADRAAADEQRRIEVRERDYEV